MPERVCKHERTRLIAKDNEAQYTECLDCGEILEAGELQAGDPQASEPQVAERKAEERPGFDESLSDA